jgi:hypothetical protein
MPVPRSPAAHALPVPLVCQLCFQAQLCCSPHGGRTQGRSWYNPRPEGQEGASEQEGARLGLQLCKRQGELCRRGRHPWREQPEQGWGQAAATKPCMVWHMAVAL